jgi:hypothetical protein
MSVRGLRSRLERGEMRGERVGVRTWIIPETEIARWRLLGRQRPGPKGEASEEDKMIVALAREMAKRDALADHGGPEQAWHQILAHLQEFHTTHPELVEGTPAWRAVVQAYADEYSVPSRDAVPPSALAAPINAGHP